MWSFSSFRVVYPGEGFKVGVGVRERRGIFWDLGTETRLAVSLSEANIEPLSLEEGDLAAGNPPVLCFWGLARSSMPIRSG